MNIVYKKVKDLIPYENNPRYNDGAVDAVANSIKEFGFKVPCVIDSEDNVVTGHTRIKACKKLGIEEVPCIVADDLTDEQLKAFRLADNKVGEIATWDTQKLNIELSQIKGLDMNDFGFPVQIEDIDIKGIEEFEHPQEEIATELNERQDYVVLTFETTEDWERAQMLFNLKVVATSDNNVNIRRHGIGRVVNGKRYLDMLEKVENDGDDYEN